MPVLEGHWGSDIRMRDSGLGVCPEEPPGSPEWGPLRTPPVTCGGLSLTLELPALIRQLRAAWRARRGGPCSKEKKHGSTWVEAEKEAEENDENSRAHHLEGNVAILVNIFLDAFCLGHNEENP